MQKLNYIPNWTIKENWFKLRDYELHMALIHCNILSDFFSFLASTRIKVPANHEKWVKWKKKAQFIFSTSQLSKKNAGRYRLDFDPHYPLLLIQCLLKSYFGPQCYTWCIMAYSHEKQSKEVQMDIFRKFKICYAQGNKPHIVISLSSFF